jgi:hypothetical protein
VLFSAQPEPDRDLDRLMVMSLWKNRTSRKSSSAAVTFNRMVLRC